jgi:5'-3' exonuclease
MMKVILIDAKNALFRFGWSNRSLMSDDNVLTGALFGVITAVIGLKNRYPDAKFVLAWDPKSRDTWRSKIYASYKSRGPAPNGPSEETKGVLGQIPLLEQLAAFIGIIQIKVQGLEADDLIGLLAAMCQDNEWEPIIYSSDQDYLQLVCRGVDVITSVSATSNDSTKLIKTKYRCAPEHLLAVRAFLGDKSDNIPRAVPGVGDVGAIRYVLAGVDPSVKTFAALPRRVRDAHEKLQPYWDTLHRNYTLMRIPVKLKEIPNLDCAVGEDAARALAVAVSRLGKKPRRGDYEEFISWLATLNMLDAIKMRVALWNLQA